MTQPYLGEIRLMAFNFAPRGWALCNGQTLSIQQNNALFAVIGTFYGGNGVTTFQLPNLQGRVPISQSNGFAIGTLTGTETHTLIFNEMPLHNHSMQAIATTAAAAGPAPVNSPGQARISGGGNEPVNIYAAPTNLSAFNPAAITTTGGNQPHENRQPYLVINFSIALQGVFPSRN
jgi:microcystin-dependent protein